jgi:NADH:ubiquinone reductase (non-electrogenic)
MVSFIIASDSDNTHACTESLRMKGAEGIFAIGDCTATSYAPTAQVASQEGAYLARVLKQLAKRDTIAAQLEEARALADNDPEKKMKVETMESQHAKLEKLRPFRYSHQGSLAYIGSDKAIADLPFFSSGNLATGGVATVRSIAPICLEGFITDGRL